jgi:hypothetical protein
VSTIFGFSKAPFLLLALTCASCSMPPEPQADLSFVRFTKNVGSRGDYYELTLTSNVDFFSADWAAGGKRAPMTPTFVCSLDDDTNFSINHTLRRTLAGYIVPSNLKSMGHSTLFTYAVEVDFTEGVLDKNDGHKLSESYLVPSEVIRLLAGRTSIPCKVVRAFYFSLTSPYYSNTMYVPVKAILDEVSK